MSFSNMVMGNAAFFILLLIILTGTLRCETGANSEEVFDNLTTNDILQNNMLNYSHVYLVTVLGLITLFVIIVVFAVKLARLRQSKDILEQMNAELTCALAEVKQLSRHDPLTGLPNRRAMLEKIDSEMIRYKRSSKTFVFIMIDIDNFKSVNDRYGHETGDFLLKELALIFRDLTREQDMVCRWGGEEFLLLLPETDVEGGFRVAEKIRITVESRIFKFEGIDFNITISSGLTDFSSLYNIHEHIKVVDDAMYQSKRSGKNRITTVSMIRKKS